MVFARPDEQETCAYHFSFHFFTMVRRASCGDLNESPISTGIKRKRKEEKSREHLKNEHDGNLRATL